MSEEIEKLRSIINKYRSRGTLDLDEAFRGLLVDNLEAIYVKLRDLEKRLERLERKK